MKRPQGSEIQPMVPPVEPARSASPPGYDRQLILALLGGSDDASISAQADALDRKRRELPLPSEVVTVRRALQSATPPDASEFDELTRALAGERQISLPLSRRSRLYLVGEGNAIERTLAGWPPAALAALLAHAGLREVASISIVGAGAGRDPDRDEAAQADAEAISFASLLHRVLRDDHGVVTSVNARVGAVRVLTQGMSRGATAIAAGSKLTGPQPGAEASEHHAPQSKLRIWWDGDRQRREWSY